MASYIAGHNGARRKLKRYLVHIDGVLASSASYSEQYDEIVRIAMKIYHVFGDVSRDDPAQEDWKLIQDTLRELDWECVRDDALSAIY